jgi:hypothetical protein
MKCQICGRSDNGCYVTLDEFFCHTEEMEMMEILAQDPSAFDHLLPPDKKMATFKIDEGTVISIDKAVEEHNLIREAVANAFVALESQHPVEYQKFNGMWMI